MSVPFGPFVLTWDDITKQIRSTFEHFIDPRQGKHTRYTRVDAGLSAFSVFFMQSPSLLEYQRRLEQTHGTSNAQTLFGVHQIPSDHQIRHRLDATPASHVKPWFASLVQALNQAGVIERYRSVNQTLLLALAGTAYFSSQHSHCPNCSTRRHANGKVPYFQTALTPELVKPGLDKVIPLAPEFVQPPDDAEKQDGERNAAQRGLATGGEAEGVPDITLLGDARYGHEPFCREALARGFGFILVGKPAAHARVSAWVALLERRGGLKTVVRRRWTGKRREIDTYRYATAIPRRDGDEALQIKGCELTTTDAQGQVRYHHAFATSLALDERRVVAGVAAGRRRWKIENENNNTLKTKGYHFEHHYGHGQQYLSSLLASLILLAFLVHTTLAWLDDQYPLLRQKLPSRKRVFNDIRTLTSYLCFASWEALMEFMLNSFEPAPPQPKTG